MDVETTFSKGLGMEFEPIFMEIFRNQGTWSYDTMLFRQFGFRESLDVSEL